MQVQKCLFCFSPWTGSRLLGLIGLFKFGHDIYRGELFRAALLLMPTLAFIWMILKDKGQSRLAYFFAYLLYTAVFLSIQLYQIVYGPTKGEKAYVNESCSEIA